MVAAWILRLVQGLPVTLAFAALTLASSSGARGGTISLAWDSSPDPLVAGYNLYYGVGSRNYTNVVDAGTSTSATISGLVAGATYSFAATAYASSGLESDYSVEVTYTVPLPNQPPTLDPLYPLWVLQDAGPQVVGLTGISSGSASETQALSVSAFSSNPNLVPNPEVDYTSPAAAGTITLRPVAGSFGTATITVMVDDGGSTNNTLIRSFLFTVSQVNQPPTLNPLSDLVIAANAGLQTVSLSGIGAGANETQNLLVYASSDNPHLIAYPRVSYTSPNTTGTLTFASATNASGKAVISVTVDDGQSTNNTVTRTFAVTVNPPDGASTNQQERAWTLWWQNTNGVVALWNMDGMSYLSNGYIQGGGPGINWKVVGTGDFNGDGHEDLLFEHVSGYLSVWLMNGTNLLGKARLNPYQVDPSWRVVATADFDHDGRSDLLWQSTSGYVAVWYMSYTNMKFSAYLSPAQVDTSWKIVSTGDFNQDGQVDILWQNTSGSVAAWFMSGTKCSQSVYLNPAGAGAGWTPRCVSDFDGDGHPDLLWQQTRGGLGIWLLNGVKCVGTGGFGVPSLGAGWSVVGPH